MTAFPETIPPNVPYTWSPRFNTKIGGPYETPVLDARIVWPYPQMTVNLTWPKRVLPSTDYVALYDFFIAMRGKATAFTFFDFNQWKSSPVGIQWNHVYTCVRDGIATVYDLPGKNMTSIAVYDNATLLTLTTDYTVSAGTGTDGRDKITFVTTGTVGHTVTVSFVGRRAMKAHFIADEMPFDTFYASLQAKGMAIEEVF
jgi:hypothetical protein